MVSTNQDSAISEPPPDAFKTGIAALTTRVNPTSSVSMTSRHCASTIVLTKGWAIATPPEKMTAPSSAEEGVLAAAIAALTIAASARSPHDPGVKARCSWATAHTITSPER